MLEMFRGQQEVQAMWLNFIGGLENIYLIIIIFYAVPNRIQSNSHNDQLRVGNYHLWQHSVIGRMEALRRTSFEDRLTLLSHLDLQKGPQSIVPLHQIGRGKLLSLSYAYSTRMEKQDGKFYKATEHLPHDRLLSSAL